MREEKLLKKRGKIWKVERGKAQSRWPGSRTEQDSREMSETERKPESADRPEQGDLTGIKRPLSDKGLPEPPVLQLPSQIDNSGALPYGQASKLQKVMERCPLTGCLLV